MTDFETLGTFYLGKRYDLATRARQEDYVLYDAKDLTTHAVIIGMTGSGKTGLGIGLLEEALIDKVPVIAIDPKGDLGNLALRFPSLAASDFRPWVDPQQAANAGVSPDAFAQQQATLWKDGLAGWGEDGARVQRLVDSADVTIYTPGSTAGRPLSLLRAFVAPPAAVRDDSEALRERVDATATSVLALLGIDADPITSREHILLANLLASAWSEGRDLDLAGVIGGIQSPPFSQVGVMPLDTVFPPKDRMDFAMQPQQPAGGARIPELAQGRAAEHGQPAVRCERQAEGVDHLDRAPRRRRAHVLHDAAARRYPRLGALAARHGIAARDPLHRRAVRLHAAGGQSAQQGAAADAAQAGARLRAWCRARHAESGRPRLSRPVQHGHLVHRPSADRARQDARDGGPRGRLRRPAVRPRRHGTDHRRTRQARVPAAQRA